MLRTVKPKNARSKRAMQAREPKELEDPRTAIFVRGTHAGDTVNAVMKDLMALKRPNAISFAKKNTVRPFEDTSSLDFWAQKNDASMFVVGQSTKKRPNGLVFVRMFDGCVLDRCEVGVEGWVSMGELKTPKSTPGHKPAMHFASELFDAHPRFVQLKSMLLDFFGGAVVESVLLAGLEHVISVSLGPAGAVTAGETSAAQDAALLPRVHVRAYTIRLLASGTRTPRVELTPMGPSLDLCLRRHTEADAEMLKQALRRPKLRKQDVEKGLGTKRKNVEVDEMGDVRGRIHVAKQDLGRLQTRKMKGLKAGRVETGASDGASDGETTRRKRRRSEA